MMRFVTFRTFRYHMILKLTGFFTFYVIVRLLLQQPMILSYFCREEKRRPQQSKAQPMEVAKEGEAGISERKGEKKWSMV